MAETVSPHILIVEDNLLVQRALANALRATGYEVATATKASDALKEAFARLPDVMILDLTLDAGSFDSFREGFALLTWLRYMLRDVNFPPVIINTGDPSPHVDERARAAGVFAVIRKGDKATDILDVVRQALEQSKPVAIDNSDEAGAAA